MTRGIDLGLRFPKARVSSFRIVALIVLGDSWQPSHIEPFGQHYTSKFEPVCVLNNWFYRDNGSHETFEASMASAH
jgi:hypothetical protein